VKVVTIYAFSIENFHRSKYEVDALMDIAKVKLSQLAQHGDLLDRYGACIRVLGRKDLLKPDVIAAIDRAVQLTSRNGDRILNICCPYTGRDEITAAIRGTVIDYSTPLGASKPSGGRRPFSESHITSNIRAQTLHSNVQDQNGDTDSLSGSSSQDDENTVTRDLQVNTVYDSTSSFSSSTTLHLGGHQDDSSTKGSPLALPTDSDNPVYLSPETITPQTLTDHMFTKGNPPMDLLIRTSGVERLSDFMLWQSHENTDIVFLKVLWPEFDLWHFLPVIWQWQRRITKSKRNIGIDSETGSESDEWNKEDINLSSIRPGSAVKTA
jgi:ditrans,polycis-polyprenyl diphosphate synthase